RVVVRAQLGQGRLVGRGPSRHGDPRRGHRRGGGGRGRRRDPRGDRRGGRPGGGRPPPGGRGGGGWGGGGRGGRGGPARGGGGGRRRRRGHPRGCRRGRHRDGGRRGRHPDVGVGPQEGPLERRVGGGHDLDGQPGGALQLLDDLDVRRIVHGHLEPAVLPGE